jgi:hypothetical protein
LPNHFAFNTVGTLTKRLNVWAEVLDGRVR